MAVPGHQQHSATIAYYHFIIIALRLQMYYLKEKSLVLTRVYIY